MDAKPKAKRGPVPDPTPEEIAAACLEIRAEWSRHEAEHRYVASRHQRAWTVPTVSLGEVSNER